MRGLYKYLPQDLMKLLSKYDTVNEIRLKRNARCVIKTGDKNVFLDYNTPDERFDLILDKLLCHSYHSKLSELVQGYISLGNGYRVGIAGQAVVTDGVVTNISDIISVNIRIPHLIRGICEPVIKYMYSNNFTEGVLVYSAPGVGKTTLLRDIILRLCDMPINRRVALVDSRCEVYLNEMSRYPLLDVYLGYPKEKGIELAIRTMAPDVIICDEIGNEIECEAILSNQSSGVPIIATTHGSDFSSVIMRAGIRRLYDNRVFGCYMGIKREQNRNKFTYEISGHKEYEAIGV